MDKYQIIGEGYRASWPYEIAVHWPGEHTAGPILLAEGTGQGAAGNNFLLSDLLDKKWDSHLEVCDCQWLRDLAREEIERGELFTADEIWARARAQTTMNSTETKLALVTGASRGVGAEIARQLARNGVDVIINYRSKAPRAQQVADAVAASGQRAYLAEADISHAADIDAMMNVVRNAGALDFLILNASGGLEKNALPDYAMQLNLHAQVNLANAALPLMNRGGRIVFVTSHLAHFYHEKPMDGIYAPVAASKRAGEDALRAKIGEFAARDISLVAVSGSAIEGTITPKLLERANRGLIETRREQAGQLPDIAEFARAIIAAASDENLVSGATIYVGNVD